MDGLLYSIFYILTAFAAVAYAWPCIRSNLWDMLLAGHPSPRRRRVPNLDHLKTVDTLPTSGNWSLIGIVASGILVMILVRITLRPSFFQTPRERAER